MRVLRLAAALVLGLGVVACSDDPGEPSALPTLDSDRPSSPSLAPTLAAPSDVTEPDAEGASAFGRYFYEQVEAGFATRDPSILASISAPDCAICYRYIDSISSIRDNGETVDDYEINILASETPAVEGDVARVTVVYNDSSSTRKDAEGNILDTEPGRQNVAAELVLTRRGDSWLVTEIRRG